MVAAPGVFLFWGFDLICLIFGAEPLLLLVLLLLLLLLLLGAGELDLELLELPVLLLVPAAELKT